MSVWLDVTLLVTDHTRRRWTWCNCCVSTPAVSVISSRGLLSLSGQRGICLHLSLSAALHTSITHSQTCDWQTPIPQRGWQCVTHMQPNTPISASAHMLIVTSAVLLNPLWQAVFYSAWGDLDAKKAHKKTEKVLLFQQLFFPRGFVVSKRSFASWQETPLDLCEVTSPLGEVKTDVSAFNERRYHITTSWALYPEGRKKKEWDACWG